jgi:hypothetical protein
MNLFILSLIQKEIAKYMMDKHVSKILLEAVQMLCSAKRILTPDDTANDRLYKLAHKNHPVTIWCRASKANFIWTLDLIEELHKEWRFRYNHPDTKFHKSYLVAMCLKENIPNDETFSQKGLTPFALAMPDKYKSDDAIVSYRNYYMSEEKQRIATWNKRREKPEWYILQKHMMQVPTMQVPAVQVPAVQVPAALVQPIQVPTIQKATIIKIKIKIKPRKLKLKII